MSFEVDRDSAWAHIALCADLTWATEPPDEFIIANQRLWAQHCRVSQVLQEIVPQSNNQSETDKRPLVETQENASRRSVKDVIPESRLAQFYGNFYYDETREKCYTNVVDKSNARGYSGSGCENPDLTECWMLPEVEYWFRKLVEEPSERSMFPPRRRHCRMLSDDDSCVYVSNSGRWGGARSEDALAARVRSVRSLWQRPAVPSSPAPRAPSPPPTTRKMRARRRQRHLPALALCPAYWLDAPVQLHCDPTSKFHFDPPRPPQLADCQRAMGRLSPSVQAAIRTTAARCLPYRGTNVSRYAPTSKRPRGPERGAIWWPRDHPSPRLDQRFHLPRIQSRTPPVTQTPKVEPEVGPDEEEKETSENVVSTVPDEQPTESTESTKPSPKEKHVIDDQVPSTSAVPNDTGVRKKRLYSTVLSMSAPTPINLSQVGCVRLTQKLVAPGLLKLNSKLVLPTTRMRQPNVDNKFEELEKEALEQYKTSDESIDTKFHELEKQAVEQYSTSNSNTSCSSGNSAEKKGATPPAVESDLQNKKRLAKFHKDSVDSVVIYSQNFPDLNAKTTSPNANLKNSHTPPRGEKKERKSLRNLKNESQRAASDTDYEAREPKFKGSHKGPMRWTLHVVPPKKRHLTFCVSDFSSDEDEDTSGSIKDAGPCIKDRIAGKVKLSAHGGGDLHHTIRKT